MGKSCFIIKIRDGRGKIRTKLNEVYIYFTPIHKIEAALARDAKKHAPKHTKRTVISLKDEDFPTYDIVNEYGGYSPPASSQVSVTAPVLKENNGPKKWWILQCTKRCVMITCLVFSVIVIITSIGVTAAVLELKGKGE